MLQLQREGGSGGWHVILTGFVGLEKLAIFGGCFEPNRSSGPIKNCEP